MFLSKNMFKSCCCERYVFFFFSLGLTHVRANGKTNTVPNCSGSGKISSCLNPTIEGSRLQDSSAVQSCRSKSSAKTRGGWGERGGPPSSPDRTRLIFSWLVIFLLSDSLVQATKKNLYSQIEWGLSDSLMQVFY